MGYSDEVYGILGHLEDSGVPHRVTSVTGDAHIWNSYHYRTGTNGEGLAVDFAGQTPYWKNSSEATVQLRRIADAFRPVAHRLAEFLHPGNSENHKDHVHVAVPLGTVLDTSGTIGDEEEEMAGPQLVAHPSGEGYWIITPDGGIYSAGKARYYGRVYQDENGVWRWLAPGG